MAVFLGAAGLRDEDTTALSECGYWLAGADGGVFAYGAAPFLGSLPGRGYVTDCVVAMLATAAGDGYWLVERSGVLHAFGAAPTYPDLPALGVTTGAVTGAAGDPSSSGCWLVSNDGGVFGLGGAQYHGSLPELGVATSGIVGIAATTTGQGYYLLGADGGVFGFGDARYFGSLPESGIDCAGVVAMVTGADGYALVDRAGTVFGFGESVTVGGGVGGFGGIEDGDPSTGVVAISAVGHGGFYLATSLGAVLPFGRAPFFGSPTANGTTQRIVAMVVLPASTDVAMHAPRTTRT